MPKAYYKSEDRCFTLLHGDCIELLNSFDFRFDAIFADPPYFLSNGGISVQNGRIVSVNKGEWDRSQGFASDHEFNRRWLKACREKLCDNGTIWVSGTYHNIFSIAQNMTELGYRILNCITWVKKNPPPNLSCRYFTHSAEYILWARKSNRGSHVFNYETMKRINGGSQMKDVWTLPSVASWEKAAGKHPTQKPLNLLSRIILASTNPGAWVLDPFTGSSTTGLAANLLNRRFLGIDTDHNFLDLSCKRYFDMTANRESYMSRLEQQAPIYADGMLNDIESTYGIDLPF